MALIEINADWKQVVDSKGFRLAVVLALALIGSVLMVFGSLDVDGWKKFTPYTKPVWPLELTGGFVIFLAAIMAIRRNRVTQEKGREKYLEEVIRQVENSTRRVSMCMTRLDRSTINESISKLQAILAKKASRSINVRLIAPTAPEFVAASEELRGKGIPLRHLRLFDSSFATFDSSITVFPTKSDPRIGTVEARTIPSTDVAEALEELIEKWWWRYDALPGADFVRLTVKGILEHQNDRPLGVIAKDLGIGEIALKEVLPAFESRGRPRWTFFVIGRPCAGKTTVAKALRDCLMGMGIRGEEVYYYNDYETLYERFLADAQGRRFATAGRGGFQVLDWSVLDTVLKQANFRLQQAVPFFRALVVEFARDSYGPALQKFEGAVQSNRSVIHVKCSLDTCIRRNRERNGLSIDGLTGYVPEGILRDYYAIERMDGVPANSRLLEIDTEQTTEREMRGVVEEEVRSRFC